MANYASILAGIDAAVEAWLPSDYEFGIELPADTNLPLGDPSLATAPEDLTIVDAGSAEYLANWRQRLIRYVAANHPGASADLAAWPASGRYLIAEIIHKPTGIRAVKAYAYATIRDLIINPNLTPVQKRNQIRSALGNLYSDCQSRVAAAGG